MNIAPKPNAQGVPGDLSARLEEMRLAISGDHGDPRELFNEVQNLIVELTAASMQVPDELYEFVADLEAEIVEDFYDNLPV